MTPSLAILTFLVSWCITLFLVIPFRLGLRQTLLYNTLVAAAVTAIIALVVHSGWIAVR